MQTATWDISSILADQTPLTDEQFKKLQNQLKQSAIERDKFARGLNATLEERGKDLARDNVMAFKTAQCLVAVRDYQRALKWLENAGEGRQKFYLQGICLRQTGQYDQAIEAFENAEAKGWDGFDAAVKIVDCLRRARRLDEAADKLKSVSRMGDIRAEYHYQMGRLLQDNGLHEEALSEFEQAVNLDNQHADALFQLAYITDLYGDDEEAMEFYRRCIDCGSAPVNALLNLANLYEDKEDYPAAEKCIKQVLACYPNHHRGRMFLKDVQASMVMYYDEDQERQLDRRNKVLEIPISDFELSVRSRNCLKKMNIRTLGDLLKVTESELLAYKNFGETSLQEIKTILSTKGLRLGQMLEEHKNNPKQHPQEEKPAAEENTVLNLPVSELEMSVRSRKCLERLNINTVGELTKCTEAELLGCKNFGMTSLNEIKQSLTKHDLNLRKLDE